MEWERHKKNKLHTFHNKKTSLHIQGETQWCFWWLSTDTFANPGGRAVWGALLCFTAWALTAHEQISLSSQGREPHCSSSINTWQQDVKNYFKDGNEHRETTTSLLNINFQVWGIPPRSFNLKKEKSVFFWQFQLRTLVFAIRASLMRCFSLWPLLRWTGPVEIQTLLLVTGLMLHTGTHPYQNYRAGEGRYEKM